MKNTMKNKLEEEMMNYVSEQINKVIEDDIEEDVIETSSNDCDFRYVLNSQETKLSTSDCWLAMLTTAYLNKKEFEKHDRP